MQCKSIKTMVKMLRSRRRNGAFISFTRSPHICAAILCAAILLPVVSHAEPSNAAELPLTIVTALTLDPLIPAAGQPVTARFAVRNDGAAPVTLNRIGVGGRGPGCTDFGCANYQDLPLIAVTISPGETYSYLQQRSFATAGAYFFQISYEAPAGNWHFLGERLNVVVGKGLEISRPLTLSPSNPTTKDLVPAEFEVVNAGTATLQFQKIGVGLRGPNCAPGDWACQSRPDYPFVENLTLALGERYTFRSWRLFAEPGEYFAQVSVQDAAGAWSQLGERADFTVVTANYALRTTPLRFGVQWHPTWWDAPKDDAELALAASVGAKVIRIGPSWRMLEPNGKGEWNAEYIEQIDHIIHQANSLGIEVYLMLLQTPCWASSDPSKDCTVPNPPNACDNDGPWDCSYPPLHNSDYGDAFRKLVELYGDRVTVWEVWNEPNVARFWKPAPNAGEYTALLNEAYAAIKDSQPHATVLGGSLAGADYGFLDAMYMAGAKGAFDALALHPYTSGAPDDCTDARWSYACGIDGVRSLMLHYGDDKNMWLTEFGWATYAPPWGVTEAAQRDYLIAALAELDKREYVTAVSWYTLVNTDFDNLPPDLPHDNDFGLFERSYRPKLAAQWLQAQRLQEQLFLPLLRR